MRRWRLVGRGVGVSERWYALVTNMLNEIFEGWQTMIYSDVLYNSNRNVTIMVIFVTI